MWEILQSVLKKTEGAAGATLRGALVNAVRVCCWSHKATVPKPQRRSAYAFCLSNGLIIPRMKHVIIYNVVGRTGT